MIYAFEILDSYVIAIERTTAPLVALALLVLLAAVPFFANTPQPQPNWSRK